MNRLMPYQHMTKTAERRGAVRVHLTNVSGTGATRLAQSLLPALERNPETRITEIHLPDRGELSAYLVQSPDVRVRRYHRQLPNAVSRLLECTWLAGQFDDQTPLLVLGDLPLDCKAPQTVFVQTPHLTAPIKIGLLTDRVKFAIARWVFHRNARHAQAFIVQTAVMKNALIKAHPQVTGRVHVLAQPVPTWLLDAGVQRTARRTERNAMLSLIYPAADYPHKNHRLLGKIDPSDAAQWQIDRLTLTLAPDRSPAPAIPWVECRGFLPPAQMLDLYRHADALLFMSEAESYGFPLIEAMFVGLPIICPDLPYARTLCGDGAIYFDPQSIETLKLAVSILHSRLRNGWWPDWTAQLTAIPRDWESVARTMLNIALSKN
jgi:hypothetical protein